MEAVRKNPKANAAETEAYWEQKAQHGVVDPKRAVGVANPGINRCIDRAQAPLVKRAIREAASGLADQRPSVLDFGCGVGRWVPELTELFPDYHGMDISSTMVQLASELHPGCQFSKFDGMAVNQDDESFDLVLSIAVLHHNAYEDQKRLIGELRRLLRPRGTLLLFDALGEHVTGEGNHVFYPRPSSDWISTVEKLGFELVRSQGTAYHVLSATVTKLLGSRGWMNSRFGQGMLWLDSYFTPALSPVLPKRFHVRQLMVFRKK